MWQWTRYGGCAPYCPTEDEPPMMSAAWPANLVVPPSSQGAGKSTEFASGWWLQRPTATVASATGIDAAWSKEMFSGIFEVRGYGIKDMCCEYLISIWVRAGSTIFTLAVISAGTMVYCWKVARSLAKKPWNRLRRRLSQRGVGMRTRSTDILSPLAQLVTSEPTSSMMPEPSEPEMKG